MYHTPYGNVHICIFYFRSQECIERDKRGKQTMCIDLVYSDQGQLWQSGVQI